MPYLTQLVYSHVSCVSCPHSPQLTNSWTVSRVSCCLLCHHRHTGKYPLKSLSSLPWPARLGLFLSWVCTTPMPYWFNWPIKLLEPDKPTIVPWVFVGVSDLYELLVPSLIVYTYNWISELDFSLYFPKVEVGGEGSLHGVHPLYHFLVTDGTITY